MKIQHFSEQDGVHLYQTERNGMGWEMPVSCSGLIAAVSYDMLVNTEIAWKSTPISTEAMVAGTKVKSEIPAAQ